MEDDATKLYSIMFDVVRKLNHEKNLMLFLLPTIDGSLLDNRSNVDTLVNMVKNDNQVLKTVR